MPVPTEISLRKREILEIATRNGAVSVRLFGSAARDALGRDSDVDFLVVMEPERSLLDHAALMQDLGDLWGRPVDVVTERSLHPALRDSVLAEAVAL